MGQQETPDTVEINKAEFGGDKMATQKIRIKFRAYEHELLDQTVAGVVDTLQRTGASYSGPIPLPTEKEIVTILRSPHKYKDSREQFEQRTHKRIIDVYTPSAKTMDDLRKLDVPAGVSVEIDAKN